MSVTLEVPMFQPRPRPRFKREGESVVAFYDQDLTPVREAMAAQWGGEPLSGRVALAMEYRVAPPKRASKATRARMLAGEVRPKGANIDGLLRAVLDAAAGVVVVDDRQVAFLSGIAYYDETPGCKVRVGEAVFCPM